MEGGALLLFILLDTKKEQASATSFVFVKTKSVVQPRCSEVPSLFQSFLGMKECYRVARPGLAGRSLYCMHTSRLQYIERKYLPSAIFKSFEQVISQL